MKEIVYVLTMLRYGAEEGHHYTIGVYSDLAVAVIDGMRNKLFRANKYEPRIEITTINDPLSIQEVPFHVAKNFAKLKFPESFDDKSELIEETK